MDALIAIALLAFVFGAMIIITKPERIAPAVLRLADVNHASRSAKRGGYIQHQEQRRHVQHVHSIVLTDRPACEVRFRQPLPIPIHIQRRRPSDLAPQTSPISSGIVAFDERFIVSSPLPELAEQILSSAFCHTLLDDTDLSLTLDERGLRCVLPHTSSSLARVLPHFAERLSHLASALEAVHQPRPYLLSQLTRARARMASVPTDLSFLPEPGFARPRLLKDATRQAGIDLDQPFVAQLSHGLEEGSLMLYLELRQNHGSTWRRTRFRAPVHNLDISVLTLPELTQTQEVTSLEEEELVRILAAIRGQLLAHGVERWGVHAS